MSSGIFLAGRKLIEAKFKAGWASRTPVKYENVKFQMPATDWVACYVRWGAGLQVSIGPVGARDERHAGVVVIQIFTPKDSGPAAADGHCDFAASIFRMQTDRDTVAGIEIEFRAPERQDAGEEKLWMHKNVIVPFQLDGIF